MTAQMNHISHRTLIEDRPTTTVRPTAPTTSEPKKPNGRRGPGWIGPLVAVGAVVAIGAVLVIGTNSDPAPEPSTPNAQFEAQRNYWETRSFPIETARPSAQEFIDQSIAEALAERTAVEASSDVPFATPGSVNDPFRRSDQVPAPVVTTSVFDRSIVAIDHATAQDEVSSESFDRAEANRMDTLRELSAPSKEVWECGNPGQC